MSKKWGKHMVERYEVVSVTCDACGKYANGEPNEWTDLHTSHSDWGNDSIESAEHLVACSAECLAVVLRREVENYDVQDVPTLRVSIGAMDYGTAKALAGLLEVRS